MSKVVIKSLQKEFRLIFNGQKVVLPDDLRKKVDTYWQKLILQKPQLKNGEVFTVTSIDSGYRNIELAETDYAHYLYSQQVGGLGEYTVRIIHPAALVITSDNKLVLGEMGDHTSMPGIIQCCGGIDHNDLEGNVVNIRHAMLRELMEELNIDVSDMRKVKSFSPAYLKIGGSKNKMTVAFLLHTNQTSSQIEDGFDSLGEKLRSQGKDSEFKKILAIDADRQSVETFIQAHGPNLNEYVAELLKQAVNDL